LSVVGRLLTNKQLEGESFTICKTKLTCPCGQRIHNIKAFMWLEKHETNIEDDILHSI
jgi:hypothetical protein